MSPSKDAPLPTFARGLWVKGGGDVQMEPPVDLGDSWEVMSFDDLMNEGIVLRSGKGCYDWALVDHPLGPDALSWLSAMWRLLRPDAPLTLRYLDGPKHLPDHPRARGLPSLMALAQGAGYVLQPLTNALEEDGVLQLTLLRSDRSRYRTQNAGILDATSYRNLFHQVFHTEMAQSFWDWKYHHGRGFSVVVHRADGALVAHYGGMLRDVLLFGRHVKALQVGDVMVTPKERGVLTRRGAFFEAASAFQEAYFGCDHRFKVAYGFPMRRAMVTAETHGLYREVDQVTELEWPAKADRGWFKPRIKFLVGQLPQQKTLDQLWSAMAKALNSHLLVIRDKAYLRYRYLEHPHHRYEVLLVLDAITRRPLSLAVVRRDEDQLRLMDLVGHPLHIAATIKSLRDLASRWGCSRLTAWVATSQRPFFKTEDAIERVTEIVIPERALNDDSSWRRVYQRWWITMGDTDFL